MLCMIKDYLKKKLSLPNYIYIYIYIYIYLVIFIFFKNVLRFFDK